MTQEELKIKQLKDRIEELEYIISKVCHHEDTDREECGSCAGTGEGSTPDSICYSCGRTGVGENVVCVDCGAVV